MFKGAIVRMELPSLIAGVVAFQYNPETVTRSLQVQGTGDGGGDRSEALRLKGPPIETIKMEVEIDATDQMEEGKLVTRELGIYPQLSALEMLTYPKSEWVLANKLASKLGSVEILPAVGPFTLLIWGLKRVVPVRLTELSITEEMFDDRLNPIRAKVSLGLRILSYHDLPESNVGHYLSYVQQIAKEGFAAIGSIGNTGAVFSSSISAGNLF